MTTNKPLDNPSDAFAAAALVNDLPKFTDELLALKGKIVEIYTGDQNETISYAESSVPKNCVIIGRLLEVFDRVIKLDCYFVDSKTGKISNNNLIYLNQFQMRLMTELNGVGCLDDVFLGTKSSEKVRKAILAHEATTPKK